MSGNGFVSLEDQMIKLENDVISKNTQYRHLKAELFKL